MALTTLANFRGNRLYGSKVANVDMWDVLGAIATSVVLPHRRRHLSAKYWLTQ